MGFHSKLVFLAGPDGVKVVEKMKELLFVKM